MGNLKASSSTYAIDGPKTLESQGFTPKVPNHPPHRKGEFITDADWPGLKPIIHRLYIIENLTFVKVKEALNLDFGYNITKRQFTRKIETWGFKKNFRKNERDEIVKSGEIPQKFTHDLRINQKRVKRLQKRNFARMSLGVESEDSEMPLAQDQDFSQETSAIREASLDVKSYAMIGDQDTAVEDHEMVIEEIPSSEFRHDMVTANIKAQWAFSQSVKYDSGIPWLAELFVQLEIAETIAPTSLEPEKQWNVEEARFISGTELRDLSKPCNIDLVCDESLLAQRRNHYPCHSSARSTSLQIHNSAMHQCHWSPLLEIDIFPPSRNSNNRTQNSSINSFTSFRRKSVDWEEKLSKLERVLPANSPAIISTLECLAFVYRQLGRSREFLMTCQKLLHAREKEQCTNTYKWLESILWIVDSCLVSGDLQAGMIMHNILRPMIEKVVDSQHPLHIHFSYLMAEIFYQLDKYHDAEATIRPVIQIALVTLGLNHQSTISAMGLLCRILNQNDYTAEAERLARYNLQILNKSNLFNIWLQSANTLMQVLETRGFYNEIVDLYQHIYKLAAEAFEDEERYDANFQHHITMAEIFLKQNEMSRAIDMMKRILRSSRTPTLANITSWIRFTIILGDALQRNGSTWGALVCFKGSLKSIVKLISQFDEALEFYERVLGKLRVLAKKEPLIERRIGEIEDRTYEIRGRNKEDNEGSSQDDHGEEEKAYLEYTILKGYDFLQEEGGRCDKENNEAKFKLWLDDIFNTEQAAPMVISIEKLIKFVDIV